MKNLSIEQITSLIDLTSLSDSDNSDSVVQLVKAANVGIGNQLPASVCVYSNFHPELEALSQKVKKAVVAGYFPSGQAEIQLKQAELSLISDYPIDEIDFVINKGKVLENDFDYLSRELKMARESTHNKCLKVILETGLLNAWQIQKSTQIAIDNKVDFVKTSTGKTETGATKEAAQIFAKTIAASNKACGIKISGGIRTQNEAQQYINEVSAILGEEFIHPNTFRIGASSLFTNLASAFDKQ